MDECLAEIYDQPEAVNSDESLHAVVQKYLTDLRARNTEPISAPSVTENIAANFPHASVFTKAERDAVYKGVAQVAREALRGHLMRDYDANRIGQEELDLPESALLNDGYSVERVGEPVYVPRVQMTREDMEYVCKRFDGLSAHFALASRALRADFERRNSIAA